MEINRQSQYEEPRNTAHGYPPYAIGRSATMAYLRSHDDVPAIPVAERLHLQFCQLSE